MTAASPALLIFRVGARVLALDVGAVEGVAKRPPLTRVPHAPAALAGLAAIKGRATPVIELARAYSLGDETPGEPAGARASRAQAGGTPALHGHELILLRGETPVALAVDKIEGLRAADGAERLDASRLIAQALRPQTSTPRTATAPAARARPQAGISERSFLEFLVGGQRFALPLAETRAVIRAAPVAVAEADPVVRGLVPYREGVLAVVDLARLLGLPSPDGERPVVVADIGGATIGLAVERVLGALRLPDKAVAPAPAILNRGAGEARIAEIARTATGLVAVLAADRLFDAETTSRLAALTPPVSERPQAAQAQDAVVLFRLGGERYALPADAVEAVARAPAQLSPPPGAPPFLAGVMSHRGGMFPLIDLCARFGALGPPPRVVIFLRDREIPAGLLVEAVERLAHLPRLASAPPLAGDAGALFRQAAIPEGAPLLVADAAALLSQARRDLLAWDAARR